MASVERLPILVVDDDETILSVIEFLLEDEGYCVSVAANGKEALEQIASQAPSLILLDMKMPVMDGWTFASAYRKQPGGHAPIIVMTAAYDSHMRASEINAEDFIAKPFDVNDLLALVRKYVA